MVIVTQIGKPHHRTCSALMGFVSLVTVTAVASMPPASTTKKLNVMANMEISVIKRRSKSLPIDWAKRFNLFTRTAQKQHATGLENTIYFLGIPWSNFWIYIVKHPPARIKSKKQSLNGETRIDPRYQETQPSKSLLLAIWIACSEKSRSWTSNPHSAKNIASRPEAHPISRTRQPCCRSEPNTYPTSSGDGYEWSQIEVCLPSAYRSEQLRSSC